MGMNDERNSAETKTWDQNKCRKGNSLDLMNFLRKCFSHQSYCIIHWTNTDSKLQYETNMKGSTDNLNKTMGSKGSLKSSQYT